MPDILRDEKIPFSWMVAEGWYHAKRKATMFGRGVLYKVMPKWLVREAFMYASRYIEGDEVVPEVEFMKVFERVCKAAEGTRVTS